MEAARIWAASFARWTNHEHRRRELIIGGVRYVSPVPTHLSASIAFRLCAPTNREMRMDGDNRSRNQQRLQRDSVIRQS